MSACRTITKAPRFGSAICASCHADPLRGLGTSQVPTCSACIRANLRLREAEWTTGGTVRDFVREPPRPTLGLRRSHDGLKGKPVENRMH
jgi:hypothetical protein